MLHLRSKPKKSYKSLDLTKSTNVQSGVGVGSSTLGDGLTYGDFPYGTRVQDRQICMNIPDVIMVYGIFQGSGEETPTAPSMVLASMDGPTNTTNDLIIGEEIVGSISGGCRNLYVTRLTDSTIEYIYKNRTPFEPGEVINFSDSGVSVHLHLRLEVKMSLNSSMSKLVKRSLCITSLSLREEMEHVHSNQ